MPFRLNPGGDESVALYGFAESFAGQRVLDGKVFGPRNTRTKRKTRKAFAPFVRFRDIRDPNPCRMKL
jgi:hypothetical protein